MKELPNFCAGWENIQIYANTQSQMHMQLSWYSSQTEVENEEDSVDSWNL